ncbi:hypothetical protein Lal_00043453 [Lupinus albus]|nr:hypothetical protein Lal_00043453 [Lupinus albus]
MKFQRLPGPVGQGYRLVEYISVARVRPRTSKGITDLQIAPPTKNGHAPPPIESRRALSLSILTMSGPGKFPRVSQIKPQAPLLWCPSVNSFKFQPCDHTPPRNPKTLISHNVPAES